MITDLIRNGFSTETVVMFCARLFVIFCILPVHEFAHAYTASKLGDNTARAHGRLTLNPLASLDPIGGLLILFVGFGYAKPVPVNPLNFKNPKRDMAITAVAGPLSNILMAFAFILCSTAVVRFSNIHENAVLYAIYYFLFYAAMTNVSLAVFNFLPIPPLDGSRLLELVIPDRYIYKYARYEKYIIYTVLLLALLGVFDTPISVVSSFVSRGLINISYAIFGI